MAPVVKNKQLPKLVKRRPLVVTSLIKAGTKSSLYSVRKDSSKVRKSKDHLAVRIANKINYQGVIHDELALLTKLDHPGQVNILTLDSVVRMDSNTSYSKPFGLVFPLAECNVADWIDVQYNYDVKANISRLTEDDCQAFAHRATHHLRSALVYIHGKAIVHRCVEPRSLVVVKGRIKLGDFRQALESTDGPGVPAHLKGRVGNPLMRAPEIFLDDEYGYGADVFAMGLTILLMYGRRLWNNNKHDMTIINGRAASDEEKEHAALREILLLVGGITSANYRGVALLPRYKRFYQDLLATAGSGKLDDLLNGLPTDICTFIKHSVTHSPAMRFRAQDL